MPSRGSRGSGSVSRGLPLRWGPRLLGHMPLAPRPKGGCGQLTHYRRWTTTIWRRWGRFSAGVALGFLQQAQEVLAEDQADAGAVEAAGEEGGGEVGEAGDVLEAFQGLRDAVEVGADADVLLAGAGDEMDDVVDVGGGGNPGEGA